MISFWIYLLLSFGCALGTEYRSQEYGNKNFSITCEQITNSEQNRTIICNITDHRPVITNCPFQSSIIPKFRKISITCDITSPFLSVVSDCKIVNFSSENNTMHVNTTLYSAIHLNILDVLIKFESIFSNVLSIGKTFARCEMPRPHILENFNCSIFGIGDKISTSANLTCFMPHSYMDIGGNSTSVIQCGFSEDHAFGQLSGNLTIDLRLFSSIKRVTADVDFITHSNSPDLNIQKALRLDCEEMRSDTGINIQACSVYLNEGRACESPSTSGENREGIIHRVVTSDKLWDLDSIITFNIDQAGIGTIQFLCNMAMDFPAHILNCNAHYSSDSILFDDKAIIDVTYNSSSIYIDSMELVLINVTDKFYIHGIVIERCHVGHNKLLCDIRIGKTELTQLECDIQDAQYENMHTKYPIVCNIPNFGYTIDGTFIDTRNDPNVIQLTFNGQLKSTNRPDISQAINTSCTIQSVSRQNSMNSDWNIHCNNDINIEDICEKFRD